MATNHIHWVFYQYEGQTPEGQFLKSTSLDIIADNYDEAEKKAETLYPLAFKGRLGSGSGRYLSQVIEHVPGECNGH